MTLRWKYSPEGDEAEGATNIVSGRVAHTATPEGEFQFYFKFVRLGETMDDAIQRTLALSGTPLICGVPAGED